MLVTSGTRSAERRPRGRSDDEDSLEELPPLDGESEEADEPAFGDDDLDDIEDPAADPFDDATGEEDPVEELSVEERSWLEDAEPTEGVDVDASELYGSHDVESVLGDNDPIGVDGEDFGLGGEDASYGLDGGEGGPVGSDGVGDELSVADLPDLDADDEGELDDAVGAEEAAAQELTLDEDAPFPWASRAWEPAGRAPEVGAVRSVACTARAVYALVAGEEEEGEARLVRVDLDGGAVALPADGLPKLGGGRLRVRDGAEGREELWVESREGSFQSLDLGSTFERVNEAAYRDVEPEGERARLALPEDMTVTAVVRGPGGRLMAVASHLSGRAWLAWQPDPGPSGKAVPPRTVAEIARGEESSTRYDEADVVALAWDATRGVVWAAGRFGLLAFQTRTDPASLSAPPKWGA